MKRSLVFAVVPLAAASLLAATFACFTAPSSVGSRYVKSVDVRASEGATLKVESADSAELAGTELVIPAGALSADQTITVELGFDPIVADGASAAGPVAIFGPPGLQFATPARLTLRYALPSGATNTDVFVQVQEADGRTFTIPNSALELGSDRVSFAVNGFTSFQPAVNSVLPHCQANSQCPASQVCLNSGQCGAAPATCAASADCALGSTCVNGQCTVCQNGTCTTPDSGQPPPCQTNADCSNGQVCLNNGQCSAPPASCNTSAYCEVGKVCTNGTCQLPATQCTSSSNCPAGQFCANGTCQPCTAGTVCVLDGGNSNPCTSNLDCPANQVCLNNGACSVAPGGCNITAYCPLGTTCTNGVCQ